MLAGGWGTQRVVTVGGGCETAGATGASPLHPKSGTGGGEPLVKGQYLSEKLSNLALQTAENPDYFYITYSYRQLICLW